MKLLTAIIQPHRLEAVKAQLESAGIRGMTVTEALGYGRQLGHTEVYRGTEYRIDLLPKVRLEILIADEDEQKVTDLVVGSAHTGTIGDGKVWSMDIGNVTRVRTGERGLEAI